MPEIPKIDPKSFPPDVFRWEALDHSLARLRLVELSIHMNDKIKSEESRIRLKNRLNLNSSTVFSQLLQMYELCADEKALRVYEIYCGVWKAQGNVKTSAFVRAVYSRAIRHQLRARAMSIAQTLSWSARRRLLSEPIRTAQLNGLATRMRSLEDHWYRKLEAEAKELEHSERRQRLAATVNQTAQVPAPAIPPPSSSHENSLLPTDSRMAIIIAKVQNPQRHQFLTVNEAKEYFRVVARTIYRWTSKGHLKHGGRRGSITIESIRRLEAKRARQRRSK